MLAWGEQLCEYEALFVSKCHGHWSYVKTWPIYWPTFTLSFANYGNQQLNWTMAIFYAAVVIAFLKKMFWLRKQFYGGGNCVAFFVPVACFDNIVSIVSQLLFDVFMFKVSQTNTDLKVLIFDNVSKSRFKQIANTFSS